MKKTLGVFLCVVIFIGFLACGSEEEPMPIIEIIDTDISVSSTVEQITWTDQLDLTMQLDSSVIFTLDSAAPSEVEMTFTFDMDTTEVSAQIAFTAEAVSRFNDLDPSNNAVQILLEKKIIREPTTLIADGPGDTYELIAAALAPGSNPIEVPDCGHQDFGPHIDEIFNEELNAHVFRFFLHRDIDDDRCGRSDRQRNEIKSFSPSPDHLLAVEGETVEYKWMFKLDEGFLASRNFTHLHQLKSVGDDSSLPIITFTARGSSNNMELRYAETDDQKTIHTESLDLFRGHWVEVVERVTYTNPGSYEVIMSYRDGTPIYEFSDNDINIWREGAEFIRPKWGIYRSLENAQDLRDEEVLYNNFSIQEL